MYKLILCHLLNYDVCKKKIIYFEDMFCWYFILKLHILINDQFVIYYCVFWLRDLKM